MEENRENSILIVDDEKNNILALTNMLSADYNILIAKNGKDAIETANEQLPDIILLDIIMPEMDGYEAITALKDSEKTNKIPVIFITGLSDEKDVEKGLDLGASDYITKPFTPVVVKLHIKNQFQILKYARAIERTGLKDIEIF
ncbi:MAG: response regulator [Eubacterium sp.]|jgi:PleD family two-component response regulator|nr:response regulator [Eubacterium sp.]